MVLTVTAWGQQPLQFYYKGQPLADGATVTINAVTDDWGDMVCETNPPANPLNGLMLHNLTGSDVSGTATLTLSPGTLAPSLVQWCMGSLCVAVSGNTYDKAFSVPSGGAITTQLDVTPTQFGEQRAEIRVSAQLRTVTVNIVFVNRDPAAPLTFERRAVVEEYTGTWCGYCPRGIVGLKRLDEQFGDRCIIIAVHTGMGRTEPMQIVAYPDIAPTGGVPTCTVNRGPEVDPYSGSMTRGAYHYGLDVDVAAVLDQPAEAGVELTAEWADAQQWDVRFTATTTFSTDSPTAPYRLAFVLMEDGLTGTGRDWAQVNYYSTAGGATPYVDDDMKSWSDAGGYVTDMVYDHVPVNTLGIRQGIQGSIAAPLVKGQPQTFTQLVTTLNQKVIQQKDRLYAVALLLNTETGRIVNAARAAIQPYGSTVAIAEIENRKSVNRKYYDLQGRQLDRRPLSPGIYIKDGKKVYINE